jgi:hypothetical protein
MAKSTEARIEDLENRLHPNEVKFEVFICTCNPETGEVCDWHRAHPGQEPDIVIKPREESERRPKGRTR